MEGDFGLVDSFGVDNGELDAYEKHVCFVLGAEWQNVVSTADQNPERALTFTVHAANKDRLQAALDRRQRVITWTWPHDDISEEWVYLDIAPKVSDGS